MTIFSISSKISPFFRSRRVKRFLSTFQLTKETRILDVGGYPLCWRDIPIQHITLLNTHPLCSYDRSFMTANQEFVLGDGTDLQYEDKSFDIVFSNSVIEHLGTFERQQAFAREAQRVGRVLLVQTPPGSALSSPTTLLHSSIGSPNQFKNVSCAITLSGDGSKDHLQRCWTWSSPN